MLAPLVSVQPQITFRRAPSLRDKLVYSEYKIKKHDHAKPTGTFMCGNCNYYQYMDTRKDVNLPNGEKFRSKCFVNCRSAGVVYLFQRECNCYYIGKTKLQFWWRNYRHIASINKKDPDLPLGRHSHMVHGDRTPRVWFLALDHILNDPRGGDSNYFCRVNWGGFSTAPPGLNEAFNFNICVRF